MELDKFCVSRLKPCSQLRPNTTYNGMFVAPFKLTK